MNFVIGYTCLALGLGLTAYGAITQRRRIKNLEHQVQVEQLLTDTFVQYMLAAQIENREHVNTVHFLWIEKRKLKAVTNDQAAEIRRHTRTIEMLTDEVEQLNTELLRRELGGVVLEVGPLLTGRV